MTAIMRKISSHLMKPSLATFAAQLPYRSQNGTHLPRAPIVRASSIGEVQSAVRPRPGIFPAMTTDAGLGFRRRASATGSEAPEPGEITLTMEALRSTREVIQLKQLPNVKGCGAAFKID